MKRAVGKAKQAFELGPMESIRLDVRTVAHVPLDDELEEDGVADGRAIQEFEATLLLANEAKSQEAAIGALRGWVLRVDLLDRYELSALEACDEEDGTLAEYAVALFDEETNSFNEAVEDLVGDVDDPNVLIVDRAEIRKEYQGRGLAARALNALTLMLGSGCGLVAIQPFPMQFGAYGRAYHESQASQVAEWRDRHGIEQFVNDKVAAKRKLASYWSENGFRRVGKTTVFVKRP